MQAPCSISSSSKIQRRSSGDIFHPRDIESSGSIRAIKKKFLFCMLALCLIGASMASAATINLAWDSNSPQAGGYKVFMRAGSATYNYSLPAWQGNATTCSLQKDLQAGQTYYFVVRAFTSTQESPDSNEVKQSIALPPLDSDGDGLSDAQEATYGTNPNLADTDGDGVSDGAEVAAGTDPLNPPASQLNRIWIEAENGDIVTPMIIVDNSTASSEGCICVPNGSATGGEAVYHFNITQPGDYLVWGRVLAPTSADNSFNLSMDGQTAYSWSTPVGTDWIWDKLGVTGNDPVFFRLTAGPHTLKVARREDGAFLDRLLITNDKNYLPDGKGELVGPPMTHVVIEAENAVLRLPMRTLADTTASSGYYITVPQGTSTFSSPSDSAGLAAYSFYVTESGDYRIWGRVIAPTTGDDSFFVAMDAGAFERWNVQASTAWLWDLVASDTVDPRVYRLTAGSHTFYLMQREDGTRIDKLVITKNAQYVPQGQGEPANQTPAPIALTHVELEAEAGAVTAPMRTMAQTTASGGYCVGVPQGGGTISSPSPSAGMAAYEFNLAESGNYRVWGRVIAPSGAHDSFFTAMDGGAFERWNTQQGSNWTWDQVSVAGGADPRIYALSAGHHTFYLMQREDGTLIDKLIITINPDFVPE